MVHPITTAADARAASDSGAGSSNAAGLGLGALRRTINVHVDTSGAATLTIEVYDPDGEQWLEFDTIDYSSATVQTEIYSHVAWPRVRAYLDANRNAVTLGAKGV